MSGTLRMGKKFDSYSMINNGNDPLEKILPIPYSKDVIDSYSILLPDLQNAIIHIVDNKLECIKRHVNGIIPEATGDFTQEEIHLIERVRTEYEKANLNRLHADLDLPLRFEPILNEMTWYTHLDENMALWKSNA